MGKPPRKFHQKRDKRSKGEDDEIKEIEKILEEQAPPRGSNPLAKSTPERPTFVTARKFDELPISAATKSALKDAKFVNLTAIQRAALPHALCSRDVLGAAKTGSGKTLAFLIPLLERLYRLKWGRFDGLGALIISPTRELALQIFEELCKVGRRHEMSAGLLIGGKDLADEASRVSGINILVATPGRLLQHMDETPGFDASSLQVLVLDEADRILDMGFLSTLNAIIANLPKTRQTMLFSATQTKSISALARLSLEQPEYVAAHAEADAPTPVRLDQAYIECNLPDKLDILWSFIKTHLKARVIVFLSTCKQVRFVYESFRRLRLGTPLRALHGRMSQYKRMGVYQQFCNSKAGVLLATDVAARGLDFPGVDWVVQADCPEDVASYIHRVGRTARYTSSGHSLLLVLPSEKEGMMGALNEAKVPIKGLKHNPAKIQPVTPALQALMSKDNELKEIGQRALVAYLRSIFLQPKKDVFDVSKLPIADFALSMGLPTVPKLRFLKRNASGGGGGGGGTWPSRNVSANNGDSREEDEEDDEESNEESDSDDDGDGHNDAAATDDDDELLVVKTRYNPDNDDIPTSPVDLDPTSIDSAQKTKKKKKMKIVPGKSTGTRTVFDDEGRAVDPLSLLTIDAGDGVYGSVAERAAAAQLRMAERDAEDKVALRELRKEKRDGKRARRLDREREGGEDGGVVVGAMLGGDEKRSSSDDEDDDVDVLLDSEEEGDDENDNEKQRRVHKERKRKSSGEEVAHLGMVSRHPRDGVGEEEEEERKKKRQKKKGIEAMSVAEQEALALQLLRGSGGNGGGRL